MFTEMPFGILMNLIERAASLVLVRSSQNNPNAEKPGAMSSGPCDGALRCLLESGCVCGLPNEAEVGVHADALFVREPFQDIHCHLERIRIVVDAREVAFKRDVVK